MITQQQGRPTGSDTLVAVRNWTAEVHFAKKQIAVCDKALALLDEDETLWYKYTHLKEHWTEYADECKQRMVIHATSCGKDSV
jgi:hypothetical protein